MSFESFEVSEKEEYGDLLNKYQKKEKLKAHYPLRINDTCTKFSSRWI